MLIMNGMPADQLGTAPWRKSRVSNPSGSCVEIAELTGDAVAVRNSRDKSGPALVYPRAEVAAFLQAVKNGEFDNMLALGVLGAAIPRLGSRTAVGSARLSFGP